MQRLENKVSDWLIASMIIGHDRKNARNKFYIIIL